MPQPTEDRLASDANRPRGHGQHAEAGETVLRKTASCAAAELQTMRLSAHCFEYGDERGYGSLRCGRTGCGRDQSGTTWRDGIA